MHGRVHPTVLIRTTTSVLTVEAVVFAKLSFAFNMPRSLENEENSHHRGGNVKAKQAERSSDRRGMQIRKGEVFNVQNELRKSERPPLAIRFETYDRRCGLSFR